MEGTLSKNQEKVLALTKKGKSPAQIAKSVGTTEAVVKRHQTILRRDGHLDKVGGSTASTAPGTAKQPAFDDIIPPATSNGHGDIFALDTSIAEVVAGSAENLKGIQASIVGATVSHQARKDEIALQIKALQEEDKEHDASIAALDRQAKSVRASFDALAPA